jgi:hypothetical protein
MPTIDTMINTPAAATAIIMVVIVSPSVFDDSAFETCATAIKGQQS